MFSILLLCLNLALFLYILVYGISFLLLPFVRPEKHRRQHAQLNNDNGESAAADVTVLIPCHHEGPSLVNSVESVLDQNHAGKVSVVVLMKDKSDSSFAPLQEHYQFAWSAKQKKEIIFESENREVLLICCGLGPKKDKLNYYLPKVHSTYLAFLDADHRAEKDWLSSSFRTLIGSSFVGVQSRRKPLSLKRLPQLWDSAQNHIGNELVNTALDKVVGSVFFTGTTCVFVAERIKKYRFGDCVTEDTYLSYELLSNKEKITYNPDSGSHEEVAPDLHSYIARRRRWSCGHNKAFFDLVGRIVKADVGWRSKAAVFVHGLFYTVPFAVCLLLNFYSLHLFVQYTWRIRLLVAGLALALSFPITLFVFGRHKSVLREVIVLSLWIFPQLTLLFPLILYLAEHELYFFLSSFPYFYYLFWSHLFCLLAPITLLLVGSMRIPLLQLHQLFLLALSYPLFFFLDLWSCLLGFSDFLFGRPTWAKIQRTHEEDTLSETEKGNSFMILSRWALAAATPVFLIVAFNDLTAEPNCGEPEGRLFDPAIFIPQSKVNWELAAVKELSGEDGITVRFKNDFSKPLSGSAVLVHQIDGRRVGEARGDGSRSYSYTFPAKRGWESHTYQASLKLGDTFCKRKQPFTTTHKQIREKSLYINGEPFLIKGVIPSFSYSKLGVTVPEGIAQIKALGANTIRFYHSTRDEARDAARDKQLLIIDQPHRSTWDDVNLRNPVARLGLQNRFEGLIEEFQGFPYSLFHTLGNEIEIRNPGSSVPKLKTLMNDIIRRSNSDFFAYSTYFVFLKLPAAIYGVNMLDTSETYWTAGLQTVQAVGKPFYASEFGGFVASLERTPPELRAYRVFDYWKRVRSAGAFGAVFHQSHDNYAQPVIDGLNDPLTADHPDDLRGIWNIENKAKLIKRFVADIFADLTFQAEEQLLERDAEQATLVVTNKRPYRLSDINLYLGQRPAGKAFTLEGGEQHRITLPISPGTALLDLSARYSTHHGLSAVGLYEVRLPLQTDTPTVLNYDVLDFTASSTGASGRLLRSDHLDLIVPKEWPAFEVNGTPYRNDSPRVSVPMRPSMEQAIDLQGSRDDINWSPIAPAEVGQGPHRVRFKLPRNYPEGAILLLAGLGTKQYWIRYGSKGEWQKRKSHKYRENLVPLDELPHGTDEYLYLLLPRFDTIFISAEDHPENEVVQIQFEMPKVFSPPRFEVRRLDTVQK